MTIRIIDLRQAGYSRHTGTPVSPPTGQPAEARDGTHHTITAMTNGQQQQPKPRHRVIAGQPATHPPTTRHAPSPPNRVRATCRRAASPLSDSTPHR